MKDKPICTLCGKSSSKKLFDAGIKSIVSCDNCGLTRTKNFSPPDYRSYHRDQEYSESRKLFKNIFLKRVWTIEKYKKDGRVLEIGCSIGTFLNLFKERGWEVWGVEPSQSAAVAAKNGIRVVKKFFEEATLPENYFDVVILNHTLEHLDKPVSILAKARTLLKRGGIVFVDVPNFGSLSAKIFGKYWPYLAPTEHLWHFTPQTLKKVLNKVGFRVIHTETASGIFDWGQPLKGLIDKFLLMRKSFFTDLVTSPFAFINTKIGMGTSLTMIGEK